MTYCKILYKVCISTLKIFVYLQLNEAKHNERDDKWFLGFSSEKV